MTMQQEIRAASDAEAAAAAEADEGEADVRVANGSVETAATPTTEPDPLSVVDGGVADAPPPMPATVAVIGDSIALSAEPYVTGALEGLGIEVVAYDAAENRRMVNGSGAVSSGRDAIRDVVAGGAEPELWLVALGTNDVGAFTGREAWQVAIDELMAEIPEGADVMWVDAWLSPLDEQAVEFNDALRDELRWRDDVWVLDWHARAGNEGLIVADGVHLTENGRIEYARLIGDGLRFVYD